MYVYILRKGNETIEVMGCHQTRLARLLAAGYEWVNQAEQVPPYPGLDEIRADIVIGPDQDEPRPEMPAKRSRRRKDEDNGGGPVAPELEGT